MTEFSCGTKLIIGGGSLAALKEMGARRAMVVTDPYFMKNGTAQYVADLAAPKWEIFDRVEPDPSVALAAEGTVRIQEFRPDTVIALGGGSAMDCAKAMVYFSRSQAKLVAVPTTSGSGSEVTDFAILTHEGVKHPLVDPKLRPRVAILDDKLLTALPPSLVADSGFDVLCHAMEAMVAKNASAVTDALVKDAFCRVLWDLPESYRGNQSVRLGIHVAAAMAGMAFTQAGLGVCHALAHSLGGLYHIPHGRLNAILLPAVMECNDVAMDKYAELARAAGFGGGADRMAVRNLKNGLIRLRRQLNLPETLAQAGIEPRQVWHDGDALVAAALADPCCGTNPAVVDEAMLRRILSEVTGRG